ncbi:hypothetical protein [Mycobacterium sp. MMS18-G62]
MDSRRMSRLGAVCGVAAVIAMGGLTAACGGSEKKAPETTPTTTATTTPSTSAAGAPPAPTEKSINPTGGNLFTPPVQATPAPNVPPGQHPGINGVP